MNDDIAKDVDEILQSVDKEVAREEIEKNLRKFLEYGVPLKQAKQALIQKYGGSIPFQEKKIENIEKVDGTTTDVAHGGLPYKLPTPFPPDEYTLIRQVLDKKREG